MSEPGHINAACRIVVDTAIPGLLADSDRRMIFDVLKQLDGLKKQLHRLLGT